MCVYAHVCGYVQTCVNMYSHRCSVWVCVHMYEHIHVMYIVCDVCVCIRTQVCAHICHKGMCVQTCRYAGAYVCVCPNRMCISYRVRHSSASGPPSHHNVIIVKQISGLLHVEQQFSNLFQLVDHFSDNNDSYSTLPVWWSLCQIL